MSDDFDVLQSAKNVDQILDQINAMRGDADPSLDARRQRMDASAKLYPDLPGVSRREISIAGIMCEELTPNELEFDLPVCWFHGGAYELGSPRASRSVASQIANFSGLRVVNVDYRLAPEFPYPAALEDALAVIDQLSSETGASVLVGGESAGGGLAFSAAYQTDQIAGILALSPWLDLSMGQPSYVRNLEKDRLLDRPSLAKAARGYADGYPLEHPGLSPSFQTKELNCKAMNQVGNHELFFDECKAFAGQHDNAELEVWPRMVHGWHMFWPFLEDGLNALASSGTWLKSQADKIQTNTEERPNG